MRNRYPQSSAMLNKLELSTPTPDIGLAAAKSFAHPPPALTQTVLSFAAVKEQAKRAHHHYVEAGQKFIDSVTVLKARHHEEFENWNICCGAVCGCSPQAVYKKVKYIEEKLSATLSDAETDSINEKCLSSIEKARENGAVTTVANVPQKEAAPTQAPKSASTAVTAPKPDTKATDPQSDGRYDCQTPVLDETGYPIPNELLPLWESRDEVQPAITMASKLQCFLETISNRPLESGLWAPIGGQTRTFHESVHRLFVLLTDCKLYAVCPLCEGKRCAFCRQRGMVSAKQWNADWGSAGVSDAQKQIIIEERTAACYPN